ncbi:phytanoyl-CoA dioxygenase family protein [Parafrankia sp. FMc2]|uniref:phytanoyl-CoA dioxygenase family protein n=1 Tax=Parafrankia sp. FMc2 TaxID=3233196 RepID=UPI0034D73320
MVTFHVRNHGRAGRLPLTASGTRVGRAPAVWADHDTLRSQGHASYFARNGMTVLPGLLSPSEVEFCSRGIDQMIAGWEGIPNVRVIGKRNPRAPSYDLEDRPGPAGGTVVRKVTGFSQLSAALCHCLVEHPALIDALHLILGDRVELYRDAIMFKAAEVGQEKPWHQDAVYWPFRPMNLVSAMIAIDRSSPENGCLQVVPGSHRRVVEHQKVNWELQVDPAACERDSVYIPLEPGDCLIFHSLLLHASAHNTSRHRRRVSITSYSPGGLEILDPDLDPPVLISDLSDRV